MTTEHKLTFVFVILAVAASWQLGQAGWIHVKAAAAQLLLQRAWQQTLVDHQNNKPWPWADTWPVAELIVPSLEVSQVVLAGDSGESLAFGPGHSLASAMPEQRGTVMISGHRDTHFRFLQHLKQGERLILKTRKGIHYYRVSATEIVDSRRYTGAVGNDELLLVTCYPFNAATTGGKQRYLVHAQREQLI